jgi:4-amino-4-deoxy-L-arabinose transferase-like glycosyltransferase
MKQDQISSRNYFFLICLIALSLRLMLLVYITPYTPIKYYTNPDAYNYENIALNLVNHSVFSDELRPPYVLDLHRTPLYPAFLAIVYFFSGSSRMAVVLFQILLGSLTAGLTYLFSLALLRSHQIALFASLILALDPLTIMYTNMLMTETLFTFFLVGGSITLLEYFRSQRFLWLALSAVMYAGAVLTRPIGQFLPLVLIPLIVFAAKPGQRRVALSRGLLFAALSLALIFVWVFRNHQVAGIWLITDIGEYNLAYYSARDVLEVAENVSNEEATDKIDSMIKAGEQSESLFPAERVKLERQVALQVFKHYPLSTIQVYIDSVLQFLINPGLDNICAQLSHARNVEGCKVTQSISNPNFIEKVRLKFGNMDNVQLVIAVWSVFSLFVIYTFSMIGIYVLIKNRQWFELFNLVLIIVYLILLSAGGQTTSRFRVPTIPYWSVLASVGLVMIKDRLTARRN